MHQDPFARLQPRIVEQHVLDGGIGHGDAGGIAHVDAVGQLRREARGMVGEFLREAIDVEAAHAGDVLAQVLAAARAGGAGAADQRGIRHHAVAGDQRGDAIADRDDLARRLGADAERELSPRECHAAEAPHVDVVQSDIADTKLHLAGGGGGRRLALHHRQFAVGEQLQGADRGHVAGACSASARPARVGATRPAALQRRSSAARASQAFASASLPSLRRQCAP